MKAQTINQILTVSLDRRIDSNNINSVEEQIESWISQENPENLILDAKDLAYISSAGLRLLLRLQKQTPAMKVTGVSKEVYEIFEMTGFDQILQIEKALREISVEGKELIGRAGMEMSTASIRKLWSRCIGMDR